MKNKLTSIAGIALTIIFSFNCKGKTPSIPNRFSDFGDQITLAQRDICEKINVLVDPYLVSNALKANVSNHVNEGIQIYDFKGYYGKVCSLEVKGVQNGQIFKTPGENSTFYKLFRYTENFLKENNFVEISSGGKTGADFYVYKNAPLICYIYGSDAHSETELPIDQHMGEFIFACLDITKSTPPEDMDEK